MLLLEPPLVLGSATLPAALLLCFEVSLTMVLAVSASNDLEY